MAVRGGTGEAAGHLDDLLLVLFGEIWIEIDLRYGVELGLEIFCPCLSGWQRERW